MTIREKKSALGATFLFVFAFCLGYSQPAFPADTSSHRENPAFAAYDSTPSSHPPLIEALNADVDAYAPAGPNLIPLPYAAALAEDIVLLKHLGGKKLFRPLRIGRDGHSEMSAYVANGGRNIRVLQTLIEEGVNPYRIETGRQSVTLAAAANNLEVLHFLLDRKVDPNGVPFGDNPLHKALRAGHFKAAAMLLQFKADLFAADKEGITALERIRKISSASKDPDAKALLAGAEAVASRINSRTAMTLRDAQRMLGFPDMLINSPLIASGWQSVRIGILDTGYKGLKEWLATHPEEASRTHFAHDTSGDKSPHGFVIYRLIRKMNPDAPGDLSQFHLLNVRAGQRLALYIGGNTWDVPHGLEAELLTRRGKELIPVPGIERIRPDGFDRAGQAQKAPGALVFIGLPEQNARIALRIRTTGLRPEERPRLKIRIVHAAGATGYQANGEESAGVPSTILSPNIISVGSFGRDPQTGLALPSEFSAIAEEEMDNTPTFWDREKLFLIMRCTRELHTPRQSWPPWLLSGAISAPKA
ncbi:MAG: ankyrin repeat domain-containing protein [Smithella sp.]